MERKKRSKNIILKMFVILVEAYVLWCLLLFLLQDNIMFPKPKGNNSQKKLLKILNGKEIFITTEEGYKVEAWFFPGYGKKKKKPVVIFFHGNGELIDYWPWKLEEYRKMGISVLLPEYRGYGRSEGKPGEEELFEDSKKFYDLITKREDVDRSKIIYHGRSLGGGVACKLASKFPPKALILQSTFISVPRLALKYLVPPFLVRNPFYNDRIIPKLQIPILIIHGKRDKVIPVWHGRYLSKLAKNCVYYEVDSGHNDMPMDEKFWEKIHKFLKENNIIN